MSIEDSPVASADDAADAAPRVVLFDFDGVLVHGDSFSLFVRDRYARPRWRPLLVVPALPWLLLVATVARWQAIRALVHIALLGLDERRYRQAADAFADRLVRRPGQFCRDGLRELRRHQAAGERVIVVTGCERALAGRLLALLGLPEVEVIGSELRAGWFGMRVGWHNIGKRKVQALAAHGVTAWRRAYGDSLADAAMMRGAAEPVLVNAGSKLCRKVERRLGRAPLRVEWH